MYSSLLDNRVIDLRQIKLTGHVAGIPDVKITYNILVGQTEQRRTFRET